MSSVLPKETQQYQIAEEDEISLLDILFFLKKSWKTILIAGILGFLASGLFLLITPNQYEASAQIAMAQISATGNNNLNPLGVNIEEPALLISRLSSPSSYTPAVIQECNLHNQRDANVQLSKAVKLTIPKGVGNVVDLKTTGTTSQDALSCANAVFDLIKITQAQLIIPYIDEAKTKLADDEERLQKARELVAKSDKSGQTMSAAYLSTRDEIRFLLDEITSLKNVIISNQTRATRLIAPIYVSDQPVSPKKRVVLAGGLLGGFFLGLLLIMAGQMWNKVKRELQEKIQEQI